MKKKIASVLAAVLVLTAAAMGCGTSKAKAEIDPSSVDYEGSVYKHINNGGVTDNEKLPYNIDAITGATLTVEGPGVVASIPLSIRELENRSEFAFRGFYQDSTGEFIYEGIDLYHIVQDMTDGDNGIFLTDSAYKIQLKDCNRAIVAELKLEDVAHAHEIGKPVLIAYGIGTPDGETCAPFVFDADGEDSVSLGYIDELDNDDGCLRLVFDLEAYDCGTEYETFSNVAYIYICEEEEPGFKHTGSAGVYSQPEYTEYIVTFRGEGLGAELNLTVEELENLVRTDESGKPVEGGIGYSDQYSLANNAYWYVNEYEGLDLYKLLCYLGMDTAEDMGRKLARTTIVTFNAADGKQSSESFSVEALSYPDAFGFYNKNAADQNDGSYIPTNADLVDTGYPVLLAYGVNRYPYTIHTANEGYLSGLSNNGGPMRVVFGKTQYNHANGSNQVQMVSEIIVGDDVLYNTHAYTDDAAQHALADAVLAVTVNSAEGEVLMQEDYTVAQVEEAIYGEAVAGNEKAAAKVKNVYENGQGGTDILEGIDLEYFLMNVIKIPGTTGTVIFETPTDQIEIALEDLFAEGVNREKGIKELPSILAFAKNGAPLVTGEGDAGYVESIGLSPFADSDPASYRVENSGGPLMLAVPADVEGADACILENVTSITINIEPDSYAHLSAETSGLAEHTVRFYGEGLEKEAEYRVEDLEARQREAKTMDYSILNDSGGLTEERYRGIKIYDIFAEIGIKSNAGDVTVYAEDGSSVTIPLSKLKGQTYKNYVSPDKQELCAMLAYGSGVVGEEITRGTPLMEEQGGPLKLIVPMEDEADANAGFCMKNVAAIEVSANDVTTWSHSMSDVFNEFLDHEMTLTIRNDKHEWTHVFTIEQLEKLESLIVREDYTVLELGTCEGIDLWKFVKLIAGDVDGIENPVSVTTYAEDGYKNDLLSNVYLEGLEKGILNDAGERVPVIIAYAFNGTPLVDDEDHPGYTGLSGNAAGPLRTVVENIQGASLKYFNKLVVTVPGEEEIDISVDESIFGGN